MKLNHPFLIVLVSATLCFTGVYGQNTHYVTLNVDTDALKNNQNAGAVSYFTTDDATEVLNNDSPETFTILVDVGDNIVWDGVSTAPSNEAIRIKKIKYKRGPRIFSNDDIDGEVSVAAGIIRGTGPDGYVYTIQFQVGDKNRVFTIDPVIKTK